MNEPLYTLDILRLAAASGGIVRLDDPDASASRRAAICGSNVTIDLALRGGVIAAAGGQVRACAFGQASALLFLRAAEGKTGADIEAARDGIAAWLERDDAALPDWPGIATLAPARRKSARHAAILLPFDAAIAAFATTKTAA